MNTRRLIQRTLLAVSSLATGAALHAQANPDLTPPAAREKVLADAKRVLESRGASQPLPATLPNPFLGKDVEAPAASPGELPIEPTLSGTDLLARLAARIPSTGTVVLGGEPLLLLGQKRLKVGDTYAISFEGQSYELTITAVTPTSFTVKRGENFHTRPVRMTATSTNTRP